MAITYYNSVYNGDIWPSGTTSTFTNNDVGSGTDRFLLVHVFCDRGGSTPDISSVTYAGVSMTAAAAQATDNDGKKYRPFYLVNPTSGSNSIVVTTTSDTARFGCIAVMYNGVNQSTPINTLTTRHGSPTGGATISFNETSNSGETVVWCVKHWNASSYTWNTSAYSITERAETANYMVYEKAGSATSTSIGATVGLATSYSSFSVALVDSAGAAGGIPKTTRQTLLGIG